MELHNKPSIEDIKRENRQFDRRLIKSFFSLNKSLISKKNLAEMMKIMRNLINKKQVILHCSDVSRENLFYVYENRIENIDFFKNLKFIESKDKLIFLSL